MSNWSSSKDGNTTTSKSRTRKATIKPHPDMSEGNLTGFHNWVEQVRTNNGAAIQNFRHQLGAEARDVQNITIVYHSDGITPSYAELKFSTKQERADDIAKTYRVLYRGAVSGSANAADNAESKMLVGFEPANAGLYIPTNAKELVDTQSECAQNGTTMLIVWCEGEKTRKAVAALFEHRDLVEHYHEKLGLEPVTSATLGGAAGIKHTNYALRPSSKQDPDGDYTIAGVNDLPLRLLEHKHLIVIDKDPEGFKEADALAYKLTNEYGVAIEDISFVDPPDKAPSGWDDADPLPHDLLLGERLEQYINCRPHADWRYRDVKGQRGAREVDPENESNRRLALRLLGIEAFSDKSTNTIHVSGGPIKLESTTPTADEAREIARCACLRKMMLPDQLSYLEKWDATLRAIARDNPRDLIAEETMAMIAKGRQLQSDANTPEQLFIRMFDLDPKDEYAKMAGHYFIRDNLAMRLRPAHPHNEIVQPQLLYVFYGNEGIGKSTAVKVLSGAMPSGPAPRYTDQLGFEELKGSETHASFHLFNKVAGITVVEFADKQLGDQIKQTLAGRLKNVTNQGETVYREMHGNTLRRYRNRHTFVFTTNSTDILSDDMGSRRWIIIDTTKSRQETPDQIRKRLGSREPNPIERKILEGHNPGLNWVADNLSAMFAHMYDTDAWKAELNAAPEMLAQMKSLQADFHQQTSWQDIMTHDLGIVAEQENIAITPAQIALYAQNRFRNGEKVSAHQYGAHLRKLGWEANSKRDGGNVMRLWVKKGTLTRLVKQYAKWEEGGIGVPGRWRWDAEPNPSHVKIYADDDTINKVPF